MMLGVLKSIYQIKNVKLFMSIGITFNIQENPTLNGKKEKINGI